MLRKFRFEVYRNSDNALLNSWSLFSRYATLEDMLNAHTLVTDTSYLVIKEISVLED